MDTGTTDAGTGRARRWHDMTLRKSTYLVVFVAVVIGITGYIHSGDSPVQVVGFPGFVNGPLTASDVLVGYGPDRTTLLPARGRCS